MTPDYGEPWTTEKGIDGRYIHSDREGYIAEFEDPDGKAQRAAACVNACAGIATPERVVPVLVKIIRDADNDLEFVRQSVNACAGIEDPEKVVPLLVAAAVSMLKYAKDKTFYPMQEECRFVEHLTKLSVGGWWLKMYEPETPEPGRDEGDE